MEESQVSREHQILIGEDGLISDCGWKAHNVPEDGEGMRRRRGQPAEIVRQASREDIHSGQTFKHPLPGAVGWPGDDDHGRVAAELARECDCELSEPVARHLVDTYGMRSLELAKLCGHDPSLTEPIVPGRVEIMAQVDFGVHEELAASVSDIMIRRTQIFFRDFQPGPRLGREGRDANGSAHRMVG